MFIGEVQECLKGKWFGLILVPVSTVSLCFHLSNDFVNFNSFKKHCQPTQAFLISFTFICIQYYI